MPSGRSLRASIVGSLGFSLFLVAGCGESWVAPSSNPLPVGDEPQFGSGGEGGGVSDGGAGGKGGGGGGRGGAGGTGGGLPPPVGDCVAETGPAEVVKVGTPGKVLLVGCVVTPDKAVPFQGEVLIESDTLTCV